MKSLLSLPSVFLALLSCQTETPGPPSVDSVIETAPVSVLVTVSTETVRTSLSAGLFGVNVEWIEGANGMADQNGTIRPAWSQVAQSAGIDHVRWPGGTFSDYYHWIDGTGPIASRPVRSHHTDPASEIDRVGTAGIARWVATFNGSLLLTVNAGTGTPAEAADWVKYANAPINTVRSADGLTQPLGVELWEIGNELYLPNNPGDPKVAVTASVYAQRFVDFATAMRSAVPGHPIRLVAISEASSTWYPMTEPGWLKTLLARAGDQIDVVSVHQSYHPVLYNAQEASRGLKEVYQALWAAPEAVGESLDATAAELAASEVAWGRPAGSIGIGITEWGTLFGSDRRWVDHGKTLGSALYIARLFQVYAHRERLILADAFKLTDSAAQGWVGFDGSAKPAWMVFTLMSRQKGFSVLRTDVEGSLSYDTERIGSVEARNSVQEVTTLATQAPDGRSLWLTLVNRAWDSPYQLRVDLPGGWEGAVATVHRLAASSVTDHNGPDVRPWIPSSFYDDPPRTGPVAVVQSTLGTDRNLTLPARSFTAVEFRKPKEAVGVGVSDPFGVDFEDDFGAEGASNRDSGRLRSQNRTKRRPKGPKGLRPLDFDRDSGRPRALFGRFVAQLRPFLIRLLAIPASSVRIKPPTPTAS